MHDRDPANTPQAPVAALIERWHGGDMRALDELLPLVYADLRGMAAKVMATHRGHRTLQPTVLVHDVFLRLAEISEPMQVATASHFFNLAARIMRQLLVDRARRQASEKHGGAWQRVDFEAALAQTDCAHEHLSLAVDAALAELERVDARLARIVELRFYVGLSVPAVAAVLQLEKRTVYRDWALAKIWLKDHLDA